MTVAASIDGTISEFALSADGKRLAFQGTPRGEPVRSYDQPELYVTDVGSKAAPRLLTGAYDGDVGGGLTGDQRAPRGSLSAGPIWSRDGRSIFVRTADHGRANLQRVDAASGKIEALTTGDQEIVAYDATPDGGRLALVVSTPTEVGDLYVLDAAAVTAPRRLTRVNETLFSELQIGTPEEIVYPSFDGKSIQAWILKPPGFDPGKRYPLILNIHGGPHAAYGATFDHEFQWMAAKGYVVLYPNPRGSTSYGQDFGNVIQYRYPGDDAKDLLAGVDVLVKRGPRGREAARRDGGQRRRGADQLDHHADEPLRGRRLPALDLGLGRLLVHRGLLAVPAHLVQGAHRGKTPRTTRRARPSRSSRTSRRPSC
jgi:dipeptidyl aminopeptidase/acylaminoacyl peptidase